MPGRPDRRCRFRGMRAVTIPAANDIRSRHRRRKNGWRPSACNNSSNDRTQQVDPAIITAVSRSEPPSVAIPVNIRGEIRLNLTSTAPSAAFVRTITKNAISLIVVSERSNQSGPVSRFRRKTTVSYSAAAASARAPSITLPRSLPPGAARLASTLPRAFASLTRASNSSTAGPNNRRTAGTY